MEPVVTKLLEKDLNQVAVYVAIKGTDAVKTRSGVDLKATKWEAADLEKLKALDTELETESQSQASILELIQLADVKDARRREIDLSNSEHAPWYNKAITSFLAVLTVGLVFFMFWKSVSITSTPAATGSLEQAKYRMDSLLTTKWPDSTKAIQAVTQLEMASRAKETAQQIVDLHKEQRSTQKEIILYILGVLSAVLTQVYSYYFGSSRGSARKDETISKLQK
jgi:hypothetical protein